MKLKWQIGIIALLSLCFPILMWLTLSRLNLSYQNNLLNAGRQQANLIANSIEQYLSDFDQPISGLIAEPLTPPIQLNGLSDEWLSLTAYEADEQLQFKLGQHRQQLYLWVLVKDTTRRAEPGGDQISIAFGDDDNIALTHIQRQAEGPVNDIAPLKAYWHETAGGYQLELRLPDQHLTRLGVVATDQNFSSNTRYYGHYANNNIQLKALFKPVQAWHKRLSQITPNNARLVVTDDHKRPYYDINKTTTQASDNDWLTNVLYPLIFASKNNGSQHNLDRQVIHRDFQGGQITLTLTHPLSHRNLIRTFIQTIGWLFVIALMLLLLFFAYAAVLAWRIRRLSRQLRHVLDESGIIHKHLPSLKAADEVGDLSRDLHQLLNRMDQYTDYLKQLGSRLSHEMKTPIGIIQSSLDNVSHHQLPPQQQTFIDRAAKANTRLKFILNQLSSLSRLQQAINENEQQTFDLNQLLEDLLPAYQNQLNKIQYFSPNQAVMIKGNPDLMAQLLDKVMDNAMDFSLSNHPIQVELSLHPDNRHYQLTICNQGPTIPTEKLTTVFESLHSYRSESKSGHLGIGLYVAQLIARFHHADIHINNQYQPDGVVVTLAGMCATDIR